MKIFESHVTQAKSALCMTIGLTLGGYAFAETALDPLASETRYIHRTYIGTAINSRNPADPSCGMVQIFDKDTGKLNHVYLATDNEYIKASSSYYPVEFDPKPSNDFPGFTQLAKVDETRSLLPKFVIVAVQGADPFYSKAIASMKKWYGPAPMDEHERSGKIECENLKLTAVHEAHSNIPVLSQRHNPYPGSYILGNEIALPRTDGVDDFNWMHIIYRGEATEGDRQTEGECVLSLSVDQRTNKLAQIKVTTGRYAAMEIEVSGDKEPYLRVNGGKIIAIVNGPGAQLGPVSAADRPGWLRLGQELLTETQTLRRGFSSKSLKLAIQDNIYVQGDDSRYTAVLATKQTQQTYQEGRRSPEISEQSMQISCKNLHEVKRKLYQYLNLDGAGEPKKVLVGD